MKKVGHAGTLDPMASGVLLILLGQATKLSDYLMNHDKEYIATLELGKRTTTLDSEGTVSYTHLQATLGANIKVPTVTGEEENFYVPDGTQSGTRFTLKNKGFRKIHSNFSGDLIFTVQVQTPKKLSKEQRELFIQLARTMNEQPPLKKRGFFG